MSGNYGSLFDLFDNEVGEVHHIIGGIHVVVVGEILGFLVEVEHW
jgi:hypothetical protein